MPLNNNKKSRKNDAEEPTTKTDSTPNSESVTRKRSRRKLSDLNSLTTIPELKSDEAADKVQLNSEQANATTQNNGETLTSIESLLLNNKTEPKSKPKSKPRIKKDKPIEPVNELSLSAIAKNEGIDEVISKKELVDKVSISAIAPSEDKIEKNIETVEPEQVRSITDLLSGDVIPTAVETVSSATVVPEAPKKRRGRAKKSEQSTLLPATSGLKPEDIEAALQSDYIGFSETIPAADDYSDLDLNSANLIANKPIVELPQDEIQLTSETVVDTPAPAPKQKPKRGTRKPAKETLKETAKTEPEQAITKPEPTTEPPLPPGKHRVGTVNGKPALVIDNKVITPHLFFGLINSNKSLETVMEQVRLASSKGIHTHTFYIELIVDIEEIQQIFDDAAYILSKATEADPEGYFFWRIAFAPGTKWQKQCPDALYTKPDGSPGEPSIASDIWWDKAAEYLDQFCAFIAKSPGGDRVAGYHLERGEWFCGSRDGYDTSRAAYAAFQKWIQNTYKYDIVSLRSSWLDGSVTFATVDIPPYRTDYKNVPSLYATPKERRHIDYHLFISDTIANRILQLAERVKRTTQNQAIVSVSYGYTLEWQHPNSGHFALDQLLKSPFIDIIAGPVTYSERLPSQSGSLPCPADSILLNGKLFILEEDYKTLNSQDDEPDDYNPQIHSWQALEQVHLRDLCLAVPGGYGVSWMDLWGTGRLNNKDIWNTITTHNSLRHIVVNQPVAKPDIAVIVDEHSATHTRNPELMNMIMKISRERIVRSGASVGFYLLTDLLNENFPDCKLYIFLNAWNFTPEIKIAVKERLQRDHKTLVWLYAGGLYNNHKPAFEQAREITGTALKLQPFASKPSSVVITKRHPITQFMDEGHFGKMTALEPTFYSITENAIVLGEYSQTGLPSLTVREYEHTDNNLPWKSVFIGEACLPIPMIRGLCAYAGVHVWDHHDDITTIRKPFVSIHASHSGERTIIFPTKSCVYSLSENRMFAEDVSNLKLYLEEGSTEILLVDTKDRIYSLLESRNTPYPEPDPGLPLIFPVIVPEPEPEPEVIAVPVKAKVIVRKPRTQKEKPIRRRENDKSRTQKSPQQTEEPTVKFRFRNKPAE